MAELLFWPALLAYGEAAFAYFREARAPGRPGRLATWGVRIGWLAQTALLVAQASAHILAWCPGATSPARPMCRAVSAGAAMSAPEPHSTRPPIRC